MAPARACPPVLECLSVRVRNTFIDVEAPSPKQHHRAEWHPQSCPGFVGLLRPSFFIEDAEAARVVKPSSPHSFRSVMESDWETVGSACSASILKASAPSSPQSTRFVVESEREIARSASSASIVKASTPSSPQSTRSAVDSEREIAGSPCSASIVRASAVSSRQSTWSLPSSSRSTRSSVESDREVVGVLSTSSSSSDLPGYEDESKRQEVSSQEHVVAGEDFCTTPTLDDMAACEFRPWMLDFGMTMGGYAPIVGESSENASTQSGRGWPLPDSSVSGGSLASGPVPASSVSDSSPGSDAPLPSVSDGSLAIAMPLHSERGVEIVAEESPEAESRSSASEALLHSQRVIETAALDSPQVEGRELPNPGSATHRRGECKPCAYFHTKRCQQGAACQFCHLCDSGARKRMKQDKAFKKAVRKFDSLQDHR